MTISQISKKYNISQTTLRYYEKIKILTNIERDKNGIRNYKDSDCKKLEMVIAMRELNIPLELVKEYIELCRMGESAKEIRRNVLIKYSKNLADKLDAIQHSLECLNDKIENFDDFDKNSVIYAVS